MTKIFMAQWESRDHLYQAFAGTPEAAMKMVLHGYKRNVKRISGQLLTLDEIKVVADEIFTVEITGTKCLVDGREWR